ncbi:hypothetical protein N7527_012120 [Penicillium freii]|uniref:Chromo domain-containing protein n=1 Tax=Penicillium freii TaxID=48697 RepID=A0A101MF34_PENFR|nr:hypothetical protein N7527_012120 [Penicillium freii]KUM59419.1 hypothetical protein ACN42_g7727 [Penicillium freii]
MVELHSIEAARRKTHHKFGDQRTGPFKVVRVLPNAYELALPPTWTVHRVISVEHLEPHPKTEDPYDRQFATEIPSPVDAAGDWQDIVRIVGSRLQGRAKRKYYLLRRRNLGPAWDIWKPAGDVEVYLPELVREYDDEQAAKNNPCCAQPAIPHDYWKQAKTADPIPLTAQSDASPATLQEKQRLIILFDTIVDHFQRSLAGDTTPPNQPRWPPTVDRRPPPHETTSAHDLSEAKMNENPGPSLRARTAAELTRSNMTEHIKRDSLRVTFARLKAVIRDQVLRHQIQHTKASDDSALRAYLNEQRKMHEEKAVEKLPTRSRKN